MPQDITFLVSHILLDNNARTMEFGPYSSLVVAGKQYLLKLEQQMINGITGQMGILLPMLLVFGLAIMIIVQ